MIRKKTPFKFLNFIHWVIADICNYRCSYCFTKSKKPFPISPLQIVDGFKKNLKGKWEVILLGGEPFLHKDFLETVKKLGGLGYRVSVFTNFSAKPEKIIDFLKTTKGQLSGFFASLHLEYAKPEDFLKKIESIEKAWPGFKRRLFVCSVGTPRGLPRLNKIKQKFFEAGVQFATQVKMSPDRAFFQYPNIKKNSLNQINENYNLPEYGAFALSYSSHGIEMSSFKVKDKKCSAGCRSFFIIPPGDAYICATSYRVKKKYLGNIMKDDFRLEKKDVICQFKECSYPSIRLESR